MTHVFSVIVILLGAVFIATLQLPSWFYKANLDYVRSMATVAALREFKDWDLVSNEATPIASSRDQVAVTIHMRGSRQTIADGLLAREEINYALQLKTSSQCIELQPGCLQIEEKKILKTVLVKTPI